MGYDLHFATICICIAYNFVERIRTSNFEEVYISLQLSVTLASAISSIEAPDVFWRVVQVKER